MNHHLQRWITGLVALPLLGSLIYYSSPEIFSFLIFLGIELAVWEYNTLVFRKGGDWWEKAEVFIFAVLIAWAMSRNDLAVLSAVLTFCLLAAAIIFLLRIKSDKIDIFPLAKVILGFMYMPLLMSYFIALRHLPQGVLWVFLTFALAFMGDTSAFYIGRTFGKKKLLPYVSPGKTIAGTIGQITGSLLGSMIFQLLFAPDLLSLHQALILGALGGMLAQLGDLFESALKRSAGAKDAGSIIPGHGGLLDRFDSLSFLAPFVFYYQHLVVK